MPPMEQNESDSIVQIDEILQLMPSNDEEERYWKMRCIYRVPASIADLNREAYWPQVVSFGPYHHGEDHLLPMEEHKRRTLHHFLKRSGKPLKCFLESLREVALDLEESYDLLDPKWKDADQFLELMITDGCFMLEILRFATGLLDDYALNDPIFSNHGKVYIMLHFWQDMLKLANQLPMLLLDRLVVVESNGNKDDEFINRLILPFCSPGTRIVSMGQCLHVLDVFRKSLLHHVEKPNYFRHELPQGSNSDEGSKKIIATELNYAEIRFEKSKTDSLRDISFASGVLRLPVIEVDNTTESMFLNLIAFERFHIGAGYEVTSYISFMDKIIANEQDAELLRTQCIIHNAIGSDKAVAELFHLLSRDVVLDPNSSLDAVHKTLKRHCKKPWIIWRANLTRTYFSNPWNILSLSAAIFALALTIIQTVFTVLSYKP